VGLKDASYDFKVEARKTLSQPSLLAASWEAYEWHWEGIGVPKPWRRLMNKWCNRFGHRAVVVDWGEDQALSLWCKICDQEKDLITPFTIKIPTWSSPDQAVYTGRV